MILGGIFTPVFAGIETLVPAGIAAIVGLVVFIVGRCM